MRNHLYTSFLLIIILSGCATALFKANNKIGGSVAENGSSVKADTLKKTLEESTRRNKPRLYKEVITAKAITDTGLFIVHKIDEKYYLEIADSILERDILIVSRISKGATANRSANGLWGYAGDQINENVLQFAKGPGDKLLLKMISYAERSEDSSENGMYRTVRNSNLQPIVASFDIKTFNPDSLSSVIDISDFLNSDNGLLYFNSIYKKSFGLLGLQKDKSYVAGIQSFPINMELQAVNTYSKGEATATYELNTSFVLLPKATMKPRYADDRIGYFSTDYIDFDAHQSVENVSMITRWRLEPKEEDKEKYLRGELVEPKKPIVYYIDPATPQKWIPYLIQGVNDWQKAFEKAGFRNAIYALAAPTNNPEWSLYDTRHNAIVYKPSKVSNASGPHVHDPRSGEIIETHVNWYHNVMQLLHDWYMVQAAPNDPRARKMKFDDELMGQLIRFVCAHEVGHTLGLMHNFGSSSTIPVDSLRSKNYAEANGFCPSIMDYARFNYVAQPEDNISLKGIFPRVGAYDEWAIEWGYRWLPQLETREEEKSHMNKWIISSLEKDSRLWYGPQGPFDEVVDPRCQSEDIGDNSMKAGYYGIRNLKRIMSNLIEWTKEPDADYSSLGRMNTQVTNQYARYLFHVVNNIGIRTWTYKTVEQQGPVLEFLPRTQQKEAVQFLHKQLFESPLWLMNKEIFSLVGGYGPFISNMLQNEVINDLLNQRIYTRMVYAQFKSPDKSYSFVELLTDLEKGVWKEIKAKESIDFYRRSLQKIYAERLIQLLDFTPSATEENPFIKLRTDFLTIIHAHTKNIINDINKALPGYKDEESKRHLVAIKDRLKEALKPGRFTMAPARGTNQQNQQGASIVNSEMKLIHLRQFQQGETQIQRMHGNCWEDSNLLEEIYKRNEN